MEDILKKYYSPNNCAELIDELELFSDTMKYLLSCPNPEDKPTEAQLEALKSVAMECERVRTAYNFLEKRPKITL